MRSLLISAFLLLQLAVTTAAQARPEEAPATSTHRPKICLVLSGGGARGAAHVGVIEAMEKLHIPIDCIAGTSMGAIVGGLYAAGMPAQDLAAQMDRPALQADMANSPPRSRLSYRDKEDELKYLLRLEFGYANDKFFLPQGIVNGNAPGRILNVLTVALSPDQDFDKLPIPFRAVATDITNGDMVVLDHGSLADAIHASMSVPGLYPPVHIGDRLLVDGGMSRNLPVDVARKMGADVVIAVNINSVLAKGKELTDVFSVSLQVLKLYGNQNVKDSVATLTNSDTLLQPDLGDIGATDFNRMGEAIKLGEMSAEKVLSQRTDLMLSDQDYADYRAKYRKMPAEPASIDFVDVSGNGSVSAELIRARFGVKPGTPWDQQKINDGLRQLYNLGYFNRVDVVLQTKQGRTGLQIMVDPKEWHPNYLQFGIHIADDFEGDSFYELLGSYTVAELDNRGAEWRNQFELGKTRLYYTEFYQPLDYKGVVFLAPNAEYLNQTFDVFQGQDREAEYSTVFPHADLDLGFNIADTGEIRAGILYGHVVSQPRIGDPKLLPTYRHRLVAPRLSASFDTLDNGNFPSSGSYAQVTGYAPRQSLGGDISYTKVDATFGHAFDIGGGSLLFLAEGGSNLGTSLPFYEQFQLGGFLSLAGQRQGQLRGDRIFDGHVIYAWRAGVLPTGLGRNWYIGVGLDGGNVWGHTNLQSGSHGMQYGGTLLLGADTVAGPLYFGIGSGKSGNRTFFLYLGIPINGATLAPSFGN
ncbi:MAG TPA: patatin-like phospholipase family protein [Gammaproteobacteria bacterium]|nr:patatin-like phospholipase family protein [Gammaproteobacteria bacterium]